MAFLYKQKLNLLDFASWQTPLKKVVVAGWDDALKELYVRHLREHEFEAIHCPSVDAIHQHLVSFKPHLLLYEIGEQEGVKICLSRLILLRKAHPALKIVTVGRISALDELKTIMETGVNSHIDRRLSRPQDVVEVVKIILN